MPFYGAHLKNNHMQLICCLHAARYAERGGDSRQDADGYLNHHFPGFLFHHLFLCYGFYDLMNAVDGGEFQPCGGWNSMARE